MTFDLATMMAVGVLTTAIAGVLTIMAWMADRGVRALLWWAAGYVAMAAGIGGVLMAGRDPMTLSHAIGLTLLAIGPSLIWTGARLLGERRPLPVAMVAGPLLALATALMGSIALAVQFAITVAYLVATIAELWPFRRAGLRACTPLIAFVALHATVFAVGLVEALFSLLPQRGLIGFDVVFGAVHFEQLLFAMGSSIFLVAMVRERSEQRHKTTAEIDTLTGVATRRAFIDRARRDLAAALQRAEPFTLMMFDLDHFKRVNDTFGHAAGDEVLRAFAEVVRGRLRAGDLIGRLGGEEFAVMMPGASPSTAAVIANRIRRAFTDGAVTAAGQSVRTTVSGGIATAEAGATLEQVLSAADAALYRAKAQGRNRIAVSGQHTGGADSVVIRVA